MSRPLIVSLAASLCLLGPSCAAVDPPMESQGDSTVCGQWIQWESEREPREWRQARELAGWDAPDSTVRAVLDSLSTQ